ncbi:LPS export ABC transporter periplasmic protein LptC [bacterium]|nr:LPS export ABC transporter periplasmic protein LptC [bacterium]
MVDFCGLTRRFAKAGCLRTAAVLALALFLACGADRTETAPMAATGEEVEAPEQVFDSFELAVTDNGVRKGWVTAAEAAKYDRRKVFTARDLKVVFYTPAGQVNSILTSRRGIIHTDSGDMEAMDSVVVFSADSSRVLLTPRLLWRKSDNRILSDTTVEVRSRQGVVFGDGIDSDAAFSDVKVTNPTGDINVLRQ